MEPFVIGLLGILMLFVLLFLGVHVALALALTGILGITSILGVGPMLNLLGSTLFAYGASYSLSVIPLFIGMGLFATQIGAGAAAYDTLVRWLGRSRGSLGLATIGGCTFFGTLTGSSIATAVVFAKVSAPEMIRHGYEKNLSYGLVAASGAIGMMIPPSILAVVYATITEQPIGAVLLAGIGPGLTLAICLGLAVLIVAYLRPAKVPVYQGPAFTWREKIASLPSLWPFAVVVTIVMGGIYTGLFTVIEAAVVGNFVLLVLFLLKSGLRRATLQRLASVALETASLTAAIFSIFYFAQLFTRSMVLSGISQSLTSMIIGANPSRPTFVIGTSLLILLLGCFIDTLSIVAVVVPLVMPVMATTGVDPIWFGMVIILGTQVGLITPPVGMNLYAVKSIAGRDTSVSDITRGALPFLAASIVALALVIAFPGIAMWPVP